MISQEEFDRIEPGDIVTVSGRDFVVIGRSTRRQKILTDEGKDRPGSFGANKAKSGAIAIKVW